jgi:branched-chain amino acid transport system ATP-binding protein
MLNAEGMTIVLVEQNVVASLKLAQTAYVLETGEVVLSGDAGELSRNPEVRKAYLGE